MFGIHRRIKEARNEGYQEGFSAAKAVYKLCPSSSLARRAGIASREAELAYRERTSDAARNDEDFVVRAKLAGAIAEDKAWLEALDAK